MPPRGKAPRTRRKTAQRKTRITIALPPLDEAQAQALAKVFGTFRITVVGPKRLPWAIQYAIPTPARKKK